jgi:hypothetical protein
MGIAKVCQINNQRCRIIQTSVKEIDFVEKQFLNDNPGWNGYNLPQLAYRDLVYNKFNHCV